MESSLDKRKWEIAVKLVRNSSLKGSAVLRSVFFVWSLTLALYTLLYFVVLPLPTKDQNSIESIVDKNSARDQKPVFASRLSFRPELLKDKTVVFIADTHYQR